MEETAPTPTKRQLATLARRKHIVHAAAACFVEQGFHQSSIRDIAKRAGVSLGNLYNHFEGKTDLIAQIATLEADDLVQIHALFAQDMPAGDILERFISAYYTYVAQPENAVLTAEITAEAMRSPHIVAAFSANSAKTVDAVRRLIETAPMSFPEPPKAIAEMIVDLIESTARRTAFESEHAKEATLADLHSIISRLLNVQR